MANKLLEQYRGSLDYAEFVIDPVNQNSTPEQIGEVIEDYFDMLGFAQGEFRKWLLEKMQEERAKREKEEDGI